MFYKWLNTHMERRRLARQRLTYWGFDPCENSKTRQRYSMGMGRNLVRVEKYGRRNQRLFEFVGFGLLALYRVLIWPVIISYVLWVGYHLCRVNGWL